MTTLVWATRGMLVGDCSGVPTRKGSTSAENLHQAVQRLRAPAEVEGEGKMVLAAQEEVGRRHLQAPRQRETALEGRQVVSRAQRNADLLRRHDRPAARRHSGQ